MLTIKNRLRNSDSSGSNRDASCGPHSHKSFPSSFNQFNSFNLFNPSATVLFFLTAALVCGCTPAGPKALLQGEKLIEKGKYLQAIEKLKLATTLIPTNAQAWNYLGLAHHYARQPGEAEKTYRRALLIDHDLS